MAFDDLLGPRKDIPINEGKENEEAPPEGEIELEIEDLDLNDLLMDDDEADDGNGNTLGDPWGNVPNPDPDDCDCEENGTCDGC
jgi:hypothetical protein